jgi:hypothetical protein
MRMIPAGHNRGAWLVIVDNLADQTLPPWLKLNVKCVGVLGLRCTEYSNPGCLDPIPDQPPRINRDPSFERLDGVNQRCERPKGVRMAGRGELVGG